MLPFPHNDDLSFLKKWIDPLTIEEKVTELKREGKSIATLNGSFDLLHVGHLYILGEAAKQADILIVALNSDHSVREYKGCSRPIITLQDRLKMMAALECVDYVTAFDEKDPIEILHKIKPDIHVNGVEYRENCIEAECVKKNGGRLHFVGRAPGLSTSSLIKKIVDTCA